MEEWLILYGEYLLPVVLVGAFAVLLLRQQKSNSAPEYVGVATVVSKRMEPGRYHGKWSSGWNYLVTFQVGNDIIELYISEAEYQELTEGLTGMLRWQNEFFRHFDPQI